MINKQEFYYGAAIIRLMEDRRCRRLQKHDYGYIINENVFVFLKLRTKSRSPWHFNFSMNELKCIEILAKSFKKTIIVLVCGGDGICAINWLEAKSICDFNNAWISVRRNFREQYKVGGAKGMLDGKISPRRWPSISFDVG